MAATATPRMVAPPPCVAVAGNPNSGKSTLFNALTGLRQQVGNYPGVTVERREGRLAVDGAAVTLLDLPGIYSLSARSPDEAVARDALLGRIAGVSAPAAALVVVDASNLERNLYLATQIIELGLPVVVACNMIDVAGARGDFVDTVALSRELGVPVIATIGTRRVGIEALRDAVIAARPAGAPARCPLPAELERSVAAVAEALKAARACTASAARGMATLLLSESRADDGVQGGWHDIPPAARATLAAERQRLSLAGMTDPAAVLAEARYAWIGSIVPRVVSRAAPLPTGHETTSDRIDRVLTHKVFGSLVFAAVMFAMFVAIFSWAEPLMRLIERGQQALQGGVRVVLPAGPVVDLLADGVIGGAGAVVVFLPQICILFLFIAILEDSGYMARAAFLMDRLMSAVGLHGKSFIPLLSSYACAVPGIMATRTIENPRDRLATILVAPLMSCSARLPVYLTVIGAVFTGGVWMKAGVIFSMYVVGTVAALAMAALLKKTLLRGPTPTFIMELPPYHLPRPLPIVRAMWDRSKLFLTRAGTTIVAVCVVLWALAYFPRATPAQGAARVEGVSAFAGTDAHAGALPARERDVGGQLRQSYMGRLGRGIEPVIAPLGFDWRIGIGVLASFAAREVFVSSMGVVFDAGEDDASLRERMRAATWESGRRTGRRLLTPLAGVSLMVFYVLCCQCVSTLAVVRRETNSWGWPIFMFAYMTALAYVGSLAVYQGGLALGLGA